MTKPIVYAPKPEYDQLTQYLVEKEPVENDENIMIDYEVKAIEQIDEPLTEQSSGEFEEYIKPKNEAERISNLEESQATQDEILEMLVR